MPKMSAAPVESPVNGQSPPVEPEQAAPEESAHRQSGRDEGKSISREVIYAYLEVVPCWDGEIKVGVNKDVQIGEDSEGNPIYEPIMMSGAGPITEEMAMDLLDWQIEADYKRERLEADPSLKEEEVGYTDPLLTDFEGNKIKCWNNTLNRPYNKKNGDKYCQDVLQGNWAGPLRFPGETVNCESIVIGRTKEVLSGQHRLIGLILACQRWRKQDRWKKTTWPDGPPVLESVVWLGCSENPSIVHTIDNVNQRTEADVLYTMNEFQEVTSTSGRRDINTMLSNCNDLLWVRTAQSVIDQMSQHKTHSTEMSFLKRHERQKDCVRLLYKYKGGEEFKKLRMSAGQSAAIMYLMAASNTDRSQYTNGPQGKEDIYQPSESQIKWTNWKRAVEFWTNLLSDKAKGYASFKPVREAVAELVSTDEGTIGRLTEKLEVLARAWTKFVAEEPLTLSDLRIRQIIYNTDGEGILDHGDFIVNTGNGKIKLADPHLFGGIDVGKAAKTATTAVGSSDDDGEDEGDRESIEDAKRREAAEKHTADLKAKLAESKKGKKSDPTPPYEGPLDKAAARAAASMAARAAGERAKAGKPPLRGGIG